MAPLKRDGLARALELARRSAGCRGAPHAVDADIDALVEFGRIVFRVSLLTFQTSSLPRSTLSH